MINDSLQLRLYISGKSPHSILAVKNLKAICEEQFPDNHNIELIDLFEHPYRAIEDGVMLTPMLVIVSSPPISIIGNLSDTSQVIDMLMSASNSNVAT